MVRHDSAAKVGVRAQKLLDHHRVDCHYCYCRCFIGFGEFGGLGFMAVTVEKWKWIIMEDDCLVWFNLI